MMANFVYPAMEPTMEIAKNSAPRNGFDSSGIGTEWCWKVPDRARREHQRCVIIGLHSTEEQRKRTAIYSLSAACIASHSICGSRERAPPEP